MIGLQIHTFDSFYQKLSSRFMHVHISMKEILCLLQQLFTSWIIFDLCYIFIALWEVTSIEKYLYTTLYSEFLTSYYHFVSYYNPHSPCLGLWPPPHLFIHSLDIYMAEVLLKRMEDSVIKTNDLLTFSDLGILTEETQHKKSMNKYKVLVQTSGNQIKQSKG